jgi:glycosyltransferase involved in cell wall biosynthesis
MRAMPGVSYIVTIYNKAAALPFVIAGLAAQEGSFEREFIFVDDGSQDGGPDVVRRLTRDWTNVAVVEQKNSGPASAMNAGFCLARGDWIKPMDGDDVLLPWGTRRLLEACAETGCDVAVAPNALHYNVDSEPAAMFGGYRPQPGRIERRDDMLRRSLRRAQTNPSAWLARAETVRRCGGCDKRVFIQDYSIELRLASLGGFALLDEPLFLSPATMPGRLSENQAQALHDMNLALANFIDERPNLPRDLARLGFVRAAARAWAWARRHGGKTPASREFWLVCGARLGFLAASPENLRATCAAFAATDPIRIHDGEPG